MRTLFTLLVLFCLAQMACVNDDPAADRPNILLILTDDMGYGDLGMAGNDTIRTPHLDDLATKSVSFQYFYVSPVCAPTRASLLTGRYHARTGVRSVTNGFETIAPDEKTLAEYLSEAGYRTGIFGKWHLGEYYPSLPNAQGFHEYLGFRTGHTADYDDAELEYNSRMVATEGYITDALTDEALQFMQRETTEPFFCYLAYNAPHTPLQVPDSLWQPYQQMGLDERTARIYAMVENIDNNVGRMLDELEEKRQLENTIVIFMSDNGPISGWRLPQEELRYNAGLRDQKFTIYEGGIRTQSFWYWKNHWPNGRREKQVAAHIDVLPTLLHLLDIPVDDNHPVDGINLLPVIEQDSFLERRLFIDFSLETLREPAPYPGGALRTTEYKMINGTELYHLPSDPGEEQNLAEQKPELLSELDSTYRAWWQDVQAERGFELAPIPVGYAAENPVRIMPHSGRATENLVFEGQKGLLGNRIGTHPSGVDGDWITNWQEAGENISWTIDVQQAGTYEVILHARGTIENAEMEVEVGNQKQAFDWSTASTENWQDYQVAELELPAGEQPLQVRLMTSQEGDLEIAHVALRQKSED